MKTRIALAALVAAVALSCPVFATLTSTNSTVTYTANGSSTLFTVPFKFLASTDLVVTVAGVTKTLNTDYTVKGAGNATGSVTFTAAPANAAAVVITRSVPLTQTSTVRQVLPFPAGATIDNAFDRLEMQVQQLNAKEVADLGVVNNTVAAFNAAGAAIGSTTSVLSTSSTTPRTLAARFADIINVKDYGAKGDGTTDDTAAIQAAINSAVSGVKEIRIGPGTFKLASTITLGDSQRIIGAGKGATVLSYTGAGTAVSIAAGGVRIFNSGLSDLRVTTTTGATGIDVDSLSQGTFERIIVDGFSGACVNLHSATSGGTVYNRFFDAKAQTCGTGFQLIRDGVGTSSYTNDNVFVACRANNNATGFVISGGNHNVIQGGQIEVNTTGVSITEPAAASVSANTIAFSRFESNTTNVTVGANVTETVLIENMNVTGTPLTDAGSRTQTIGTYGTGLQYKRVSANQVATGSYRFERSANGGTEVPNFVIADTSSVNSPVTLQVENPSTNAGSSFFRAKFGAGIKFNIDAPSGKLSNLATTNGPAGSFTLSAAATTTVNNSSVTAGSLIWLQPYSASAGVLQAAKALYVSARTAGASFAVTTADGTAAAGTEIFVYWIVN